MKRLEQANKPFYINSKLYQKMRSTIEEAFMFEYNILIEEE